MISYLEGSKFGWWKVQVFTKKSLSNILPSYIFFGISPDCLYVILQKKTSKIYGRLLEALGTIAPESKTFKVLLDFELAPISCPWWVLPKK